MVSGTFCLGYFVVVVHCNYVYSHLHVSEPDFHLIVISSVKCHRILDMYLIHVHALLA